MLFPTPKGIRCTGVAHKGYNPVRSRRPALPVASPCWLSRRPAAGCRVALPCPRVALLAAAPPCPACESPCPARAEPLCCPHRPAARRPAARPAHAPPCPAIAIPCPGRAPLFPRRAPPLPALRASLVLARRPAC
ncbi:unnamed protein product, partial [Closterium sp. NIES-53]